MPDKTPVEDAADDDIIDLLEVVKPGKPVAPESGGDDDVDFSADLDSMLAELAKHETAADADQPFPDPTPVDHEVDPNEKLDLPSMEDLDHLLETLGATAEEEPQTTEAPPTEVLTDQGDDLDAVSLDAERSAESAGGPESIPFTETGTAAETDAPAEMDAAAELPQPAMEPSAPAPLPDGEKARVAGSEPPPAPANDPEANVFDAFEAALAATGDEADQAKPEVDDAAVSDAGVFAPAMPGPDMSGPETPVSEASVPETPSAAARAAVAPASDIPVDLDDLPFAKTDAAAPPHDPFEAAMAADAEQSLDAETIAAALDDAGLPGDSPVDPFDAVIAGQAETVPTHSDLSDPANVARAAAEEMEELRVEATGAPEPLADTLAGDLPDDFQSDLSAFPSTPQDDSPADPFEAALAADMAEERDAHIVAAAIDESGQQLVDPPGDPFEAAMAQAETASHLSGPVDALRAEEPEALGPEALGTEPASAPDRLAGDLTGGPSDDAHGDGQGDHGAFSPASEGNFPADPFEAAPAADMTENHGARIDIDAVGEKNHSAADTLTREEMATVGAPDSPISSQTPGEEDAEPADPFSGQAGMEEAAPRSDDAVNREHQETPVDQTAEGVAETQDEATRHLEEVDLNELDALLDDMLSTAPPAGSQPVVPAVQEELGKTMEERIRFIEDRLASFGNTAERDETLREMRQKLLVSQGELVEQEMAPLQTALANAQTLMTEIRQELADKEAVIAELQNALEKQAQNLEELRNEVSAGDDRYAALEERLTLLETDLDKKAAAAAARVIREEIATLLQPEE